MVQPSVRISIFWLVRNQADDSENLIGFIPHLVHLTRFDEHEIARLQRLALVIRADDSVALQHENLVLPIMLVMRGMTAWLECEDPHGEIFGPVLVGYDPSDSNVLNPFLGRYLFLDIGIVHVFHQMPPQIQNAYSV